MENFSVAVLDIPHNNEIRHDSYELVKLFSNIFNFTLNFIILKSCEFNNASEVDAFIADLKDLKGCTFNINLPPVIEFQSLAILVPSHVKKPVYTYFMIIDGSLRIIGTLFLIIFAIMRFLINKIETTNVDWVRELLNGLGLQSCQSIKLFSKKNTALRFIYLSMSFFGIMVQNYYTIYLSSYLVKGIFDTHIKIICNKRNIEFLNNAPSVLSKFTIVEVSLQELIRHISSLNISTGRCIRTQGWMKRLHYEIRNKHIIYRRSTPWMAGFDPNLAVILNSNSKYMKDLYDFILEMYTFGFMTHWAREMAVKNYSRINPKAFKSENFITLFDLRSSFIYFFIYLLISFIVFVIERFWRHRQS